MIKERIEALRSLMKEEGIDLYIVPTSDFHQSEYVGEYFKAREFISGFTGSAGTAVIGLDQAVLFTDARYFIQAERELESSGIDLFKMGEEGVPSLSEYIEENIAKDGCLAFDGRVISMGEGQNFEKILDYKNGTIKYDLDLIDRIWTDRPELSKEPAFFLDLKYSGETTRSKLERIREKMREYKCNKHVITSIDDICWILNIRGNDVAFSPLVLSYAIIGLDEVHLFIDESKLDSDIKETLLDNGVEFLHPYNDIYQAVKNFTEDDVILLDPNRINYGLYNNIPRYVKKVEKQNPAVLFKSIKNEVEVENMKKAQIKDSIAHVKFMYWLKKNIGKEKITEISASKKLDEFREEMGAFIRPSFDPISSFGDNAAIVHYSPSEETDRELEKGSLFLTDTGAGFIEGSTDITRTYALGQVPDIMKEHFTITLMANLNLSAARFLYGCNGMNLDILARGPFWDRALNFNHGTGHGIGYLLNIHEDPIGFRWQFREGEAQRFEEGMIVTNEPGIYIEGSHGIRLENELLVRKGPKNEYGQFMYFETITYIPFDLDAIDPSILGERERNLLNQYHTDVYKKLSPYLEDDEREWLKEYTRTI